MSLLDYEYSLPSIKSPQQSTPTSVFGAVAGTFFLILGTKLTANVFSASYLTYLVYFVQAIPHYRIPVRIRTDLLTRFSRFLNFRISKKALLFSEPGDERSGFLPSFTCARNISRESERSLVGRVAS